MDRKVVISSIIPIVVVLIYSEIFHVNFIYAIEKINPYFLLSFLGAYLLQVSIVSLRDSKITHLDYFTTFKARLLGNAVSLVIPGMVGPDLSRAIIYAHKGIKLDKALGLSLYESFYDVNVGVILFFLLFWIKISPLDTILILVSLANLIGWSSGLGYAYFTSGKLNRIEQKIFSLKYLKPLTESYLVLKDVLKERATNRHTTFYSISFTVIGYMIQSLPFYFIVRDIPYDILINQNYLVATLVPSPSAAGMSELSLSIVLPPIYVIQVIILELLSYSLGFVYIKDINLNILKKEVKEIWKTS